MLYISLVCSFSLLSNIPRKFWTCDSLFVYQLLHIWILSSFCLLQIRLRTFACICLCNVSSFFLGNNLGMRLLGHMVSVCLTFSKLPTVVKVVDCCVQFNFLLCYSHIGNLESIFRFQC